MPKQSIANNADKMTEDQIAEIKEAFSIFDRDNDGRISTKELGTVMRELGQNPTHQELLDMIHDVDINNDGYIDFPEFLVLMSRAAPKQNDDDEIRAAFNVFDMDGSGTISKDELRYVLRGLGENLSEKDLDEMFNQADLDGSGTVDLNEFFKMLTN